MTDPRIIRKLRNIAITLTFGSRSARSDLAWSAKQLGIALDAATAKEAEAGKERLISSSRIAKVVATITSLRKKETSNDD